MKKKSSIIIDPYEDNRDAKKPGPKRLLGEESGQEASSIILPTETQQWVLHQEIMLEGSPFSFDGHEYLYDEYNIHHPIEVNMKGAQTGYTVKAILKTTHRAVFLYKKGVLYLFPTATDVTDFSRSRYARLLHDNPTLQAFVRDTDSANLKRIGPGYFYFRGMKSRTGLKSIPVDCIVFDEFDEHLPKTNKEAHEITSVEMALERMSHSEHKHALYLSTPTVPDFGIDAMFQTSNQCFWLIKCKGCGEHTCLEGHIVSNAGDELRCFRRLKDGRVIKCCTNCGKEIFTKHGNWVPKRLDKSLPHGTQIGQPNSPMVTPQELLEAYEIHVLRTRKPTHGKPNEQEFWNSKVGWPFVSAEDRLSVEQVRACCGTHGIAQYDMGPCAMGVDQNNGIHITILTLRMNKPTVLYLGILSDWHQLDHYMNAFHVSCCVVDAQPEKRNARAFAKRFKKRVWLNFYDDSKKGSYVWDEKKLQLNVDRTESLDESHLWIARKEILLPKDGMDITEKFISHCHNVAKRRIEEKNGSIRYVYVKLGGEDHFRHSFNYAVLASTKIRRRPTTSDDINILEKLTTSSKPWNDVY